MARLFGRVLSLQSDEQIQLERHQMIYDWIGRIKAKRKA